MEPVDISLHSSGQVGLPFRMTLIDELEDDMRSSLCGLEDVRLVEVRYFSLFRQSLNLIHLAGGRRRLRAVRLAARGWRHGSHAFADCSLRPLHNRVEGHVFQLLDI